MVAVKVFRPTPRGIASCIVKSSHMHERHVWACMPPVVLEMMTHSSLSLHEKLLDAYSRKLATGRYEPSWYHTESPKKGDPSDKKNRRPVACQTSTSNDDVGRTVAAIRGCRNMNPSQAEGSIKGFPPKTDGFGDAYTTNPTRSDKACKCAAAKALGSRKHARLRSTTQTQLSIELDNMDPRSIHVKYHSFKSSFCLGKVKPA